MMFDLPNAGKFVLLTLVIAELYLPLAVSAGVDEELAEAAKSPYENRAVRRYTCNLPVGATMESARPADE